MEKNDLTETKFKIMVIWMLNELRGRMHEHNENINRDMVSIKKDIETIKRTREK